MTERINLNSIDPKDRPVEVGKRENHLLDLGFTPDWIGGYRQNQPTLKKQEVVDSHIRGLTDRGFSDPIKMIDSFSAMLGYSLDNIDGKIDGLKNRKFADPIALIEKDPRIISISFDNIDGKIDGLKTRGFANPIKLLTTVPQIFGYSFENIDGKIDGLKTRGFANPQKMITFLPSILNYSFENIDLTIKGLVDNGFLNPCKVVETFPTILGFSLDNIGAKIAGLKERGFANPQKMIEHTPAIFGYSFANIDAKIAGLKERGFSDPYLLLEKYPQIFGYGFENIDRKLNFIGKMVERYRVPQNPVELMENGTYLFSAKFGKLVVLGRILLDYKVELETISSDLLRRLVKANNLEDILVAYGERINENETIEELLARTKEVKKDGMTVSEKRKLIDTLPIDFKIKERYFREYKEKSKPAAA